MQTLYQRIRPACQLLPLLWLFGLTDAHAQQGKTGAGSITAVNTVVNEYTTLVADVTAGSATISVASSTLNANNHFTAGLAPGDLVMLIQVQGATISTADDATYGNVTNYNNAGRYEMREVASVPSGTSITFTCGLTNSYTSAGRVQVVRMPRYATLTLNANTSVTAPAWNGTTGGIVALEVQGNTTLGNGAYIDVSGLGFRGGAIDPSSNLPGTFVGYRSTVAANGAEKGESIAGYEADYDATGRYGRGAAANGGGGGNGHNAGGGGGSNVGTGTWTGTGIPDRGTNNAYDAAWNLEGTNFATSSSPGGGRGGYSYSANNADASTQSSGNTAWGGGNRRNVGGFGGRPLDATGRLFLGGGGGAGDQNDNVGTAGAAGGGLLYLLTGGTITGNGTGTSGLRANGASAAPAGAFDAAGGGGGGGTIVINTAGTLAAFGVSAAGGIGGGQASGTDAQAEGPGGGGGGGLVQATATLPATTVDGGTDGVTSSPSVTEFPPNGSTRGAAGLAQTITYNAQCTASTLTGTVFEDVNYGGGAGRPGSASGTAPRPGARVELYNAMGTFVAATITAANGQYTLEVTPGVAYTVRVVNSTVSSSRPGYTSGLLPVQTYNGTTTRVGGENPALPDAAANSGSQTLAALSGTSAVPQSIATISAGTSASTTGPDFGFNFDLVVNTNDAGQGSLRQFILNASALGGENLLTQAGFYTNAVNLTTGSTAAGRAGVALPAGFESSIFMIPAGRLTTGVAVITPASALPQLTGANTSINGATQTFNIGNTNDVLLGAGGTVGTQAAALSQLNGPEVQLVGSTNVAIGLNVAGVGSRVRGMAIYGFGNGIDSDLNGNLVLAANNVVVADNALGSTASSFNVPPVANVCSDVRVVSGTGVSFTNNLVGFAGGQGIRLAAGVTGTTITGNEIRGNARLGTLFDGVDVHGSSATVTNNLFADTGGQGFDSFSSTGSNTVTGNTFIDNGIGNASSAPQETAAARFYGTGNTFSQNVSTGNYGDGVEIAAGTTLISRNSIYANGTVTSANGTAPTGNIGINLLANGENDNLGNAPYVTLNSTNTAGANNLQNYPILRTANIVGPNLVLTGYAKPGATIELFVTQGNPATVNAIGTNFGQGRTYLTTLTEGATTTGIADTDASTGQSYGPGTINGFAQGSDTNANGFSFTIPLSALPGGTLAAGTLLTSTATLSGATSEFSGNATAVAIAPLAGYVYEDVNYGGGAGRSRATLGAAANGRPGAEVELYNSTGALVGTAITDANGQYAFSVNPGTGYTVRVVNSSVLSSRTGATAASGSATTGYVSNQLAVQTYNGTTTRVGGENPALPDAAANTGAQALSALTSMTNVPQSIATASVGTGTTNAGPDFGYNFDLIVNTANAGQGSLAQFITNTNALGGEASLNQAGSNAAGTLPANQETSIFMIPDGLAHAGLLASNNGGPASLLAASGVAAINLTAALPAIAGANTSIDGTTQTFNIGNTNNVALGAGGPVGTGSTALGQLNGPEVQLRGATTFNGIAISTNINNTVVRGLSIYGFGTGILGGINDTGTRLEQNVIGASATSFTDPGAGNRNLNEGINLNDSDGGFVTNNLIGFNGGMGVWVLTGTGSGSNGANSNTISGNEIRGNALLTITGNGERLVYDGLELQGSSTGNTVSGNLITANTGHGIDSFGNDIGGNTVSGNTISNNGVGVVNNTGEEGSGLRVFGATNPTSISNNVLTGNNGSGVLVIGGANQVAISQNSTSGNTRLGIDLLGTAESAYGTTPGTVYWNGQLNANSSVTFNDNGDADAGGNGLLNFPVLTTVTLSSTTLTVNGYARPGSLVELFLASPLGTDPTLNNRYFGQGSSFLISRTEGLAADDSNTGTGTYGAGTINGVAQGTDNTNQFTFSIPLSSLTPAQRTALLNSSALLTSTATLAGSTSEFSANSRVLQAPVPNNATNASVAGSQSTPVVLNPNLSASASGFTSDITTSTTNTVASYVVSPIATAQGTLYYNGTAVTAATTVPANNLSQLTFVPTRGFSGNATFAYTALDANGQASTTHNTGSTATNGPATYTIPVSAPLPVVLTAFAARAVANRDAQLSWHTASELNNDHFEVERSFDGTTFVQIGQVAGRGTTSATSVYTFTDANVAAQATGPVYYRLRQVDRDGTSTYSPLRTVSFTRVAVVKLTLFPNPVATRTNLDLSQLPATAHYQAQLLDATGHQVQTWTLGGGATHPLEVAGLASGGYLLLVTGQQPDGSTLKQLLRLTKE